MGLDMYMYLRKETYKGLMQNPSYPNDLKWFRADIGRKNGWGSVTTKTDYLVGYWRKAWDLNTWICDQFANNGEQIHEVNLSPEDLELLYKHCQEELLRTSDPEKAEEMKYTIRLVGKIEEFLAEHPDYDVIYHASW